MKRSIYRKILEKNNMEVNPFGGEAAEPAVLVNVPKLVSAYYSDVTIPSEENL
jgi:hypothetical protein